MAEKDIERVLLTADEIADRVNSLAGEIRSRLGDGEIVAVGVLTGAFVFLADLVRRLGGNVDVRFLRAASYRDGTRPGELRIEPAGDLSLAGRDVLVVEDIVDTGKSLEGILRWLQERGPRSITSAVLLDKPDRREVDVSADFVGFEVPDEFLVGYGLDYAGRYRNLSSVAVLRRSVYEGRD
jgi:hypoxanthine phosphoribosyltransferase